MPREFIKWMWVLLLALQMGCGNTDFSGTNEHLQTAVSDPVSNDQIEDTSHKDRDCTKRPQNILILDFKSGWWAGDGGDFFQSLLTALTAKCRIKIEYHHIARADDFLGKLENTMQIFPGQEKVQKVQTNLAQGFGEKDWNKYTQIWLLSGSDQDLADIEIDHEFFVAMLQEIKTKTKPHLFVASGYGSITHANAMMAKFEHQTRFETDLIEGQLLNPAGGVKVATTLALGQELDAGSPLFMYLESIADHVRVDGDLAKGDYLGNLDQDVQVVAKNTEGRASIATLAIAQRRFVLDAGLQRYYAVRKPAHEGTFALLRNIIRYLAD